MVEPVFEVEQLGSKLTGPCECCGSETRSVWGFVHRGPATEAAYFIGWTPGKLLEHGASFDLILGGRGEGTGPNDRMAISLAFRIMPRGPEFMVIDAVGRQHVQPDVVARALPRSDVIGTPLAARAFAVVDAIWQGDPRINELVSPAS